MKTFRFTLALCVAALLASGCASWNAKQRNAITQLETQVADVQLQVEQTQDNVANLEDEQRQEADTLQTQLASLDERLKKLPKALRGLCPSVPSNNLPADCPKPKTQVVVKTSSKMVMGELERVWLDPPGIQIVARVDTGASSSSVHAANLVEFERDGEKWVRFEWTVEGESVVVEREVQRYVRVVQQADPKGTRRPVVNMRLRIGDVEDSFDFTLANRSHLEYQIILGRNFLTDVALVDVGQQFVQPPYQPELLTEQ